MDVPCVMLLQTGDTASVTVAFPDFGLNVVEFLLVDTNRNHWSVHSLSTQGSLSVGSHVCKLCLLYFSLLETGVYFLTLAS